MISSVVEGEEESARKTEFLYDRHKNLTELRYPNGALTQREFDDRGNCIKLTNPLGAEQTMAYDQANRLIQLNEPDGNVIELKYNAYNDVILVKDKKREISYTYTPLGKVASRTELDRKIQMHYDTEGRLYQVINEIGEKYIYERDCVGRLVTETGYDGVEKKYEYSPAGKLTGLKRGKRADWINMAYDPGGYLSKITYPNGEEETFAFGVMGESLVAENKNTKLTFEYGYLGNLLKESQDDHFIESQYLSGNDIGAAGVTSLISGRVGIQSSMGLDVSIHRDRFGLVEEMSAVFQEEATWKSQMAYNMLGQVEERIFNGTVNPSFPEKTDAK
jgi:YD repeat-containing protein